MKTLLDVSIARNCDISISTFDFFHVFRLADQLLPLPTSRPSSSKRMETPQKVSKFSHSPKLFHFAEISQFLHRSMSSYVSLLLFFIFLTLISYVAELFNVLPRGQFHAPPPPASPSPPRHSEQIWKKSQNQNNVKSGAGFRNLVWSSFLFVCLA